MISTGSAIPAALDWVSNRWRTKTAGNGNSGKTRLAIAATDVNGEMSTTLAPSPRFAISQATPLPSD